MRERLTQTIHTAVETLLCEHGQSLDDITLQPVTVPKDSTHGDFTTNAAMLLAKKLGRPPRDIAAALITLLDTSLEGTATCEIAGPGFINFRLSADAGARVFDNLLAAGARIGYSTAHEGETVNVEYVSANPTGPLTVGHGRNAALGDAIAQLCAAVGYRVTREYYFNDAGNQMTVLAASVRTRYRQLCGHDDELAENAYQGEYITDIARKVQADCGDTLCETEDHAVFLTYAVATTFDMIKATLARMRVHHDTYFNEKTLYEQQKITEVVEALRARGLVYEKDGATWFAATECGGEQDRVLIKSSGEPTYRLPDIAYHCEKFARDYTRIIDVFGADHMATYPDVLAALGALEKDISRITVVIHQFVTVVRDGEVVKMSTRKANYITLDELMDEAGVDATRYFFLMRKRESHCEFDIALACKQTLENPVFYVQYAHARISSIMRHAAEKMPEIVDEYMPGTVAYERLTAPEEQELVRVLSHCEKTIETAATLCEPHRVTQYAEAVAEAFHRFYTHHQVVTDDAVQARARMALCVVTQRVIRNCLTLLGVDAPERM